MRSKKDLLAKYPLTSYQHDIWLKHTLNPNNPLCNIGGTIEISGSLDYQRLNGAINRAISSNDALRIQIEERDGKPIQAFMPELKYELPYFDFSDRNDGKQFAKAWMQERFLEVFEFDNPLFDFALVRAEEKLFFLFTKAHHLIADGMGITQLNHEIADYYNNDGDGLAESVEKTSFKEQIRKDAEYLNSTSYQKDVEFWQNEYVTIPERLFNYNSKRESPQRISSKRVQYAIKRSEYGKIGDLCDRNSCTEFHYFMASASLYLCRLYGRDEIVIDIPVLNRDKKERRIICHCANAIPIRIKVDGSSTFIELLKDIKVRLANSYRHYKLSYGQIARALKLKNENLSDITISFEIYDRKINYINTETHSDTLSHQHEQQVLNIQINPASVNEDTIIYIDYLLEIFNDKFPIESLISHLKTITNDTLQNPEKKIRDIEILTAREKHQLLEEWNDTAADYPKDRCVHQLFEEQVEKTPDNIAVVFGNKRLTYKELNKRANIAAHHLKDTHHVRPGDLVGIQLDRSEKMIISILGILKAGGAYVPIDPEYPEARIAYITQNSLLKTIIRDNDGGLFIDTDTVLTLGYNDTNPVTAVNVEAPAYVIYTSGSTGEPKGTVIRHINFVNYISWAKGFYFTDESTGNFGLFTSISFDLTTTCIFLSLLRGKTLEVFNQGEGIDTILRHTFASTSIDCVKLTPSHIALLGRLGIEKSPMKIAIVGGESLLNDHVRILKGLNKDIQIVNEYGPTEATVGCIVKDIKDVNEFILIGKPIANTKIYVINDNALAPIGVPGEICIGGDGVAKEYLHRPDLTKEKFIKNPFNSDSESRLYKTGDLARWLPCGDIEYMGRIDEQVKINGYRVELGEVEAALNKLEGISSSAVIANDDGSGKKRLIAYIASPKELNIERIRAALSLTLPDYMIPALFIKLDTLPLTPNGKIDKKTLQGLKNATRSVTEYIAPSTEMQKKLIKIWEDLFNRASIGICDNFFELGGDSILSIQIASRAKLMGVSFSPNDILKYQTIEKLAKICTAQKSDTIADQGLIVGEIGLTPIQSWFFENDFNNKNHYNQAVTLRVKEYIEPEILKNALNAIVQQHDVLRLKFKFENNKWHQYFKNDFIHNLEIINIVDKEAKDLSATIEYYGREIQTGLSITTGNIFRSVLFQTTSNSDNYLLLVIHHLAVDGVSWRILIDDLKKACQQQLEGKNIDLGVKTSSFKQWSERLCNHVQSDTIAKELPFWTSTVSKYNISLPLDKHAGENIVSSAKNVSHKLSKGLTRQLLHQTSRAYNTEINDLLLTALALSVNNWTGQNTVSLHLEGHGREELYSDTDLSRTIGWFTSLFPVCLKADRNTEIGHAIKSIKEQLRAIPSKGIGYGILRYLSSNHEIQESLKMLGNRCICFNYLGQFNDLEEKDSSIISISNQPSGISSCPTNQRTSAIDINLFVSNEQLVINWTYSENLHERNTIEALAQNYTTQLERVIEHCIQPESKGFTPSDFPLCKISQEELDKYVLTGIELSNIENIYPLSPMQEGMLFHTLYALGSEMYITQLAVDILGELDIEHFKQVWQHITDTHSVLRTSFVYQGLQTPVQRVHKKVTSGITLIDYSEMPEIGQKNAIDQLQEEQRRAGFDLTIAPLSSIILAKTAENHHTFIWTHHHMLIDGWSTPIIFKELFQHYNSLVNNQEISLKPDKYEEFIKYLSELDRTEEDAFWEEYLEGFTSPTEISIGSGSNNLKQEANHDKQGFALSTEDTDLLKAFTQKHHITINTLVQGAWSRLMSTYSGDDDIVFGITVAGRPSELEKVEEKVGLFINTLPLRIKVGADENVLDWLKKIQEQQNQVLEHQYTPLVRIQPLSGVPSSEILFKSILVFENYPIEKSLANDAGALNIANIRSFERTNYPITIAVSAGEHLKIDISYDSSLHSGDAIFRLLGHLNETLLNITQNADGAVSCIEILTPAEKHQLLVEWNDTSVDYPKDKTIIDLFEEQAEKTPNNIAVVFEEEKLTYRELNESANQLGWYLQSRGVKPDTLVGVCMDRSLDMIVGLYAILKAGGAYVPIDPNYPKDRIDYMIKDSECRIILTQESIKPILSPNNQTDIISLDLKQIIEEIGKESIEKVISKVHLNNFIYCIYTSGSTGNPKGTIITHNNFVNYITWAKEFYIKNSNIGNFGLFTSISFDLTVTCIFLPLLNGKTLEIFDQNEDITTILRNNFQSNKIDCIKLTPSHISLLNELEIKNSNIKLAIVGGEELLNSHVLILKNLNSEIRIINEYGPTEATIGCLVKEITNSNEKILIGKPIYNTKIFILSKNKIVPVGVPGEIHIAGHGVAKGYLFQPELTKQKFVTNHFDNKANSTMYKTGDLAQYLSDGNIDFLGRIDEQIKINGFRIELGEIEAILNAFNEISLSAVLVKMDNNGNKQLVAFFVPSTKNNADILDIDQIKEKLSTFLPNYMIPSIFVKMNKIPLTSNGKVDKKALNEFNIENIIKDKYLEPGSELEKKITNLLGQLLKTDKIGIKDNFFEIGGNSLILMRLSGLIKKELGINIPLSQFFKYTNIQQLSNYILDSQKSKNLSSFNTTLKESNKIHSEIKKSDKQIAIIGIACKFPGAKNINEFWNNLIEEKEVIKYFSDEELEEFGIESSVYKNENYIKVKGYLEDTEYFDTIFFGYSQKESDIMDPQLRLLHECTWEALENAGYNPFEYDKKIGLYIGASNNYLWFQQFIDTSKSQSELYDIINLIDRDNFATRLAYKLNLKGPAIMVQSACSTSLSTLHLACKSLQIGEADIAIGGCCSLSYPLKSGYFYQNGMIRSKNGHTCAFDEKANGIVDGNGIGLVVLKRLSDAIEDGDNIYAVIKGAAINNDGNRKAGYTAPSIIGQSDVINEALQNARVSASSIHFIETHGTGTKLGDAVEINALKSVFNNEKEKKIVLGAIKNNIGHLDVAAGIAGLIKTILILNNRQIPANIHFNNPNPDLEIENSPFYINKKLYSLENEKYPIRAGISSFGIGGTNAHFILEEYKMIENPLGTKRDWNLVLLSAKTEEALLETENKTINYLINHQDADIADIAYTLQIGRNSFEHRKSFLYSNRNQLMEHFDNQTPKYVNTSYHSGHISTSIIFVCHDLRAGSLKACYELYDNEHIIQKTMNHCFSVVYENTDINVKEYFVLLRRGQNTDETLGKEANQIKVEKLVIYIFYFALAQLLKKIGISPAGIVGFGLGEILALNISGIISFIDAIKLILNLDENFINLNYQESLHEQNNNKNLIIKNTVFSEKHKSILKNIQTQTPDFPYFNHSSNEWLTDRSADLSETITLSRENEKCNDILFKIEQPIWIEFGDDRTGELSNKKGSKVLFFNDEFKDESFSMLLFDNLSKLWLQGEKIKWNILYKNEKRKRIPLPSYPFERIKCCNKIKSKKESSVEKTINKEPIDKWLYIPNWKKKPVFILEKNIVYNVSLVFADNIGFTDSLYNELAKQSQKIIIVKYGTGFKKESSDTYTLDPDNKDDYLQLIQQLLHSNSIPDRIIHLCTLSNNFAETISINSVKEMNKIGYYSILNLIQAFSYYNIQKDLNLFVVTNNLFTILSNEPVLPENASIMGASIIVPQEYPHISCKHIDIELIPSKNNQLLNNLLKELQFINEDKFIGLRNKDRYIRTYDSIDVPVYENEILPLIKDNGIYLITGGLGQIGLILAQSLSEFKKIKLVLIGRSSFPSKEKWDILVRENPNTDIAKKIQSILNIESNGSKVYIYSADVADMDIFNPVVIDIEKNIGKINGVFQATGITGPQSHKSIHEIDKKYSETHFHSKIYTLITLDEVFRNKSLDFCVIFSSISSILGGIGFYSYASANIFQDLYVKWYNKKYDREWLSLNWDGWISSDLNETQLGTKLSHLLITPEEGKKIFHKVLNVPQLEQIIISTSDLNKRLIKWVNKPVNESNNKIISHRIQLTNTSLQQIEIILLEIYKDFFSNSKITLYDDFYDLGGDSLKAVTLSSQIHALLNIEIPIEEILINNTIREMSNYIYSQINLIDKQQTQPIKPVVATKEFHPLSSSQKRLFILNQMDLDNAGYNISKVFLLEGKIDKKKLETSFIKLINRHAILRTSFYMHDNEPVQKILDKFDFKITEKELIDYNIDDEIKEFIQAFDLQKPPHIRVCLVKVGVEKYYLMINLDHIVSDGVSVSILVEEFKEIYSGQELPSLKLQYKDYAEYQNSNEFKDILQSQEKYWLERLNKKLITNYLPIDYDRPVIQSIQGDHIYFTIDNKTTQQIKFLSREYETTYYVYILSVLNILMGKYANLDDILIASPVSGRSNPDIQKMIGMFVNMLIMRNFPRKDRTFREFLNEVKKNSIEAFKNQDYPFEDLIKKLEIYGNMGRNPLLHVVFAMQNMENEEFELEGIKITPYDYEYKNAQFDLLFVAIEMGDEISIKIEYSTELFSEPTIIKMKERFLEILKQVIEFENIEISKIEISHQLRELSSVLTGNEDFLFD
ncbi:MAG: amino acid adenylation domain-containing protein [Bacteroidales bacterium]|nr:amino acid adenylation domain-containing protein [Bacteroidales bacterium]